MENTQNWLEIHDPEITSAELMAEIEKRAQQTRERLGEVNLILPTFGEIFSMPDPPQNRPYNPNLYRHLRRANEFEPPPTQPDLHPSPATRIPIIGRFWRLVRQQFHELILFYVNRIAAHESKLDNHIISTINELTRIVEQQQDEIDRLRNESSERKDNQ